MELYGLIGYPLSHSFSKKYFTQKFSDSNLNCRYENFEIENIIEVRDIVYSNKNLYGLNVTIPHKESVIDYLDEIDSRAESIGAVNTIKIIREASKVPILSGFNTDVLAFKYCIMKMQLPASTKAMILGTGGAAKAVKAGLKESGIDFISVSRNANRTDPGVFTYDDLNSELVEEHKLIVNCTPLGTSPNTETCPEIPYNSIGSNHFLYDLVYNPTQTLFMKKGLEKGATVQNGYEMLVYQAERSWEIWNNLEG